MPTILLAYTIPYGYSICIQDAATVLWMIVALVWIYALFVVSSAVLELHNHRLGVYNPAYSPFSGASYCGHVLLDRGKSISLYFVDSSFHQK